MNSSQTYKHKKIVIAVDGFSSCGKSTFAKLIAAHLGYKFIDTGAMYRAVTLYALENGAFENGILNEEKLVGMLDQIDINFRFNPERGASDIYIGGEWVEGKIRTIAVSNFVSAVSAIGQVRQRLVTLQQQMGTEKGVVMDGRDIGTVVFPEAEIKIFMTADPEVRAERRYKELLEKGEEVSKAEIVENIKQRDHLDQTRAISPLRKADDAIVLDNGGMTLEEELEWFNKLYEKVVCE